MLSLVFLQKTHHNAQVLALGGRQDDGLAGLACRGDVGRALIDAVLVHGTLRQQRAASQMLLPQWLTLCTSASGALRQTDKTQYERVDIDNQYHTMAYNEEISSLYACLQARPFCTHCWPRGKSPETLWTRGA